MAPKSPAAGILDKANKKLNSAAKGGWLSFGSGSPRTFEKAGDLYQQAANQFRIDKDFKSAGDSFVKEAECREKSGERNEKNEVPNAWWNAAKVYKQGFPDLAIKALNQAVTYLTKAGRFKEAADREKEIAQIYVQESSDFSKACESYERAADWYAQENAHDIACTCYKDAADCYAQLNDFPTAISRYEKAADHSLMSTLTKYNAKEYWLRAGLCALAMREPATAKQNMERYGTQDVVFPTTREGKLLGSLIEVIEAGNREAFNEPIMMFDKTTKLDNWKTNILMKIKQTI